MTSGPPSAYLSEEAIQGIKKFNACDNLATAKAMLAGLDMEERSAFYIDKKLTVDARILGSQNPTLALAQKGKMSVRVRSKFGFAALGEAWKGMDTGGPFGREVVSARVKQTFNASGGTELTLGRILSAYPKRGATVLRPVTRAEAMSALSGAGINLKRLNDDQLRPFPLLPQEDGRAITVNRKATNGYPVLGDWDTPGAAEKVMGLAVTLRRALAEASKERGGVQALIQHYEDTDAQLVALMGKAKGDYYKEEKLGSGKLRFYNAFPKQILLNMQVATQVIEGYALSYLQGSNSFSGVNLLYGGADELVAEMDQRLSIRGRVYIHMGDDSWVVVRVGNRLVWFALDCSNFDLTQHNACTKEVHHAVHTQLQRIDVTAADLWLTYARERLVVVTGTLAYKWKHAGPSGMPMQSKTNGMLMEVLIERSLATPETFDWTDAATVDSWLQAKGDEMGFKVRCEQHHVGPATSIRDLLERQKFLFVGYYFYARGGEVRVFGDWARQMAQLPYPGFRWVQGDSGLKRTEAMRIGSLCQSLGVPPPELEAAFDSLRRYAIGLVKEVLLEQPEDPEDPRLVWAVGESPFGPPVEPNLRGLLRVLEEGPEVKWLGPNALEGSSMLIPPTSWADMADLEEAEQVAAGLEIQRPGARSAPAIFIPRKKPPTHPLTAANHGRPPPTAVWGPPKQPRSAFEVVSGRRNRRGRVLDDEEESYEYSFDAYSEFSSLEEEWQERYERPDDEDDYA